MENRVFGMRWMAGEWISFDTRLSGWTALCPFRPSRRAMSIAGTPGSVS